MMPALFSGVSGLRNHQFRMNVIGNNLANVNTIGYKYSRVSFADLFYQTIRDASAPQAVGGANPVQMGLGSLIHSVDVVNTQGNLETTGRPNDLSIQGEGYFVLNDGAQNKYTRAGVMMMGLNGTLVNPSDGLSFMGWNAVNGVIDTTAPLSALQIPVGSLLPAQATTRVTFAGNLNAAGSVTQGTVAETQGLLASAAGGTLATDLRNGQGTLLGLGAGNVISITGSVGGTAIAGASLTINPGTTLNDIAAAVQAALRSVPDGDLTETAVVQADGSILVTSDGGNAITNLQLTYPPNAVFNTAFRFPVSIAAGGADAASDTFRRPAVDTDAMVDLFSATGASLGLAVGDDLTLMSGTVRGSFISSVPILADITNATSYADYRDALRAALFTTAPAVGEDVAIQADGSLRLTGSPGAANGVAGLLIGSGANPGENTRTTFAAAQSFSEIQKAADATSYRTTVQVFDSLGNPIDVDVRFVKSTSNNWEWTAFHQGNPVGNGALSFSSNGVLANPTASLSIPLANGAGTPLAVDIDFTGSTQFAGNSTIALETQDGFPSSTLSSFSVGQDGQVIGLFANGRNVALGQLAVASFRNASGLLRQGRNLLAESPNSGVATMGAAGSNGRGIIVSGTLEMSNVDVAREFTDMIVTQRGFQANSRVVTASDQLLEELVNLKR